jgi:hypothetical protein
MFKANGYAWYSRQYVNNLQVNVELVSKLRALKNEGHEIYLWTNRGESQVKMTMENMKDFVDIFSGFYFYDGKKLDARVDGIIIDNEVKYSICGTGFIHIQFTAKQEKEAANG